MRTKDEMSELLSKRLVSQKLKDSNFGDLVQALQTATQSQKDQLVKKIAGNRKDVTEILHSALLRNAQERAKADVDIMLANNTLSLDELDTLLG